MKESEDAYGHLIYDHHRGERALELIERDDGLIQLSSGAAAYFAPYEEWPDLDREAVDLVHGRVLDIGCGAGRHALYLQEKGLEVVGIDSSPLAVRVCRERGLRDARQMSVTQISSRLGCFDTVLMMGNNFGLMANPKRGQWLLRRMNTMASPEAMVIAASLDVTDTEKSYHLAYHRRNRERGRLPGQIRIRVRYLRHVGAWFDYLLVSRDEMESIVEGSGWRVERFLPEEGAVYIGVLKKV